MKLKIMEGEKVIQQVLRVSPYIRFVGLVTEHGKLEIGNTREGVTLFVDKEHQEMLFMEVALRVRMRREFDCQLGPVSFTVSTRGKATIMSFPFGNDILYVCANTDVDLKQVPTKILKIIRTVLN